MLLDSYNLYKYRIFSLQLAMCKAIERGYNSIYNYSRGPPSTNSKRKVAFHYLINFRRQTAVFVSGNVHSLSHMSLKAKTQHLEKICFPCWKNKYPFPILPYCNGRQIVGPNRTQEKFPTVGEQVGRHYNSTMFCLRSHFYANVFVEI